MKAIHMNMLPSTNSYLAREFKAGRIKEDCFVVVDYQEEGRGQGEKGWHSELGENLLMSVLLFPAFLSASHQFCLSMAASLAVCELLERDLEVGIKWPNDILTGERKMGGILIENSIMDMKLSHSIIGLGLNVNQEKFPNFPRKATSLLSETGNRFEVKELALGFASILSYNLNRLKAGESGEIEKEYLDRLYLKDKASEFETKGGVFKGTIKGVSGQGELVVEREGRQETFGFQEISFLE